MGLGESLDRSSNRLRKVLKDVLFSICAHVEYMNKNADRSIGYHGGQQSVLATLPSLSGLISPNPDILLMDFREADGVQSFQPASNSCSAVGGDTSLLKS